MGEIPDAIDVAWVQLLFTPGEMVGEGDSAAVLDPPDGNMHNAASGGRDLQGMSMALNMNPVLDLICTQRHQLSTHVA